ncbi:outer membrane protein assembly factor BamA [Maridesulfovibrio ferrireducens]|uniref:outer membrane protein assembly factor BamA n=1 Tax=Maridesulfovibrio ferrireducens TaxID=246191 RepID=UPI001A33859B|nr:outer membrane protein assembly factor BamA [Maridesulfovibrio ferrireducens]MBI9110557.1 outer membrane protein assembly factor BamA [Maridesulfovibrio ferrireducens]
MPRIRFLFLLIAATLAFLLNSGTEKAQAEDASSIVLAVLPFEVNANADTQYLKDSLPTLVSDRLREAGFRVVDQKKVMQLVDEQGYEFLNLQSAKDMALLAGSGYSIYGSFSQIGEDLSLDVRLVEAFGMKPAVPLFVSKKGLINLLPAVDELVAKVKLELLSQDKIADVEVVGTRVLDKDVVMMRTNIKVGDIYTPYKINTDLKNIYALGYFEDVKVKVSDVPGGKKIVFEVVEKPRIQAITVQGADAIDSEDILSAVNTKKGAVLNPKVLSDDLNTLREMYRKEGYYKAKVDYNVDGEGAQARLNLKVDEGKKLYIEGIIIQGAEKLDPEEVKAQLALTERGWLSWFTKTGVLKEELLERDAAAILAYYGNRGFIDAKVGEPEVEIKDDGIYVTFQVSEGNRYKVGSVELRGDLIVKKSKLKEIIAADDMADGGEYLDRSVLREDMKALSDFYANFGYAYADAKIQFDQNAEDKTVAITFLISKRQKVHIRRVIIEGNSKTRNNVILREMRLADGDQFSGFKLQRSIVRLNKLDYFSEVDIEPIPTGDPSEMDLKVKVKDKNTGMVSGGIGYSTSDSVFISAKITERNLFGRGWDFGLNGGWSSKSISYGLNFYNPRVGDTLWGAGAQTYWRNEDFDDYDKQTIGAGIEASYPVGEYTNFFTNYRLDNYYVSKISETAAKAIKDIEGYNWSSIVTAGFKRDTTNKAFNPSTGTLNTATVAMGGGILMGDDSYVKYTLDSNYFTPVFWDLIFHWRGKVGFVHDNLGDGDIPVFEKFYLGGINNVRGYSSREISPRDSVSGDRVGGNKMMFMNFELLFPINEEFGLVGVTFFDIGNTWGEGDSFFTDTKQADGKDLTLGLYKSIGAGIRWFSPMGPIRVEYGYGLDNLEDSSRHKIEFSMGQFF